MPELHNRGSHSFRLSQDVNTQQHTALSGGLGGWGVGRRNTLTHTHAHMDTRTHSRAHAAYALHVLLCWVFFFFFWSLFISWGHAPPLLVAHRSTPAHAPKGNTCTRTPPPPPPRPLTLPHSHYPNPKPQPPCEAFTGFKVFSRRAAYPSYFAAILARRPCFQSPPPPRHPPPPALSGPAAGVGGSGREREEGRWTDVLPASSANLFSSSLYLGTANE